MREGEQRFRAFADTAPAMLWIADVAASCSFVSRGWYDYTGQDEQAALGFGWLDAVHPDDRAEAKRVIMEVTSRREAYAQDFRLRRADGEYRWALNSGRPRFDARGDFAGYAGSVMDIHERKRAALESSLLGAIVDSCDDAIVSKDLTGVITSWNRGAERLFGYTAAEAIGQSVSMLIPAERLQEEPTILAQLRLGQRVDHFETIRVRKDGSRLNISLTISPVKDADGRIVGASKVARDITESVRNEQALREANIALERANADLQQFAYSASHDLQEPLRMVAAFSQLLRRKFAGELGPEGDEYIGYTIEGAVRMDSLLRDLRMYTQVSTTEAALLHEVDADAVLDKALGNLEISIKESGASIRRTALPQVRIHEFQLQQVFQNLIANAIRYRGGLPPQIDVSCSREDSHWLFSVKDNGIGIDPQFNQQIFGIFKRLHSASEYPGTGMGLAICRLVIERAGGRIWVDSKLGEGATFCFTIPVTKA